jgi:hypothetical protein
MANNTSLRFGGRDNSGNPFGWSFSLQPQSRAPANYPRTNIANQNAQPRSIPPPDFETGMDAFHANFLVYQQNIRTYQHNMYDYMNIVDYELRQRTRRGHRRAREQGPSWTRFTPTTDLFSRFAEHFQNVIVAPTTEEITNATRNIVFNEDAEHLNTNCPITLENFATGDELTQIIHCGHIFHGPAIQNWFRTNVHCPVCRYDIRNRETDSSGNSVTTDDEEGDENNNTVETPPVDELVNNITNGLSSIIQNYLDNDDEQSTINTNQLVTDINTFANQFDSMATSVEFEFPLLLYRDLSGNRRTFI